MWIAQISDPHLRPTGESYKGAVDSNAALATAIAQINRLDPVPDLVLLTGDIVDEGRPEEYAMARDLLVAVTPKLLLIPGNHDEPTALRAAFAGHAYLPAHGPLNYVDDHCGPVRIVALDVTVPGKHHGELTDASLAWLDAVLAQQPTRPTIVMMHQPPLVCGVPYLDAYRFMGGERLATLLSRHSQVERLLCGHVHRQMQMRFGGTLLMTAPSIATAIALRPHANATPASFLEPPGFLLHHWRDGSMLTHHVPIGRFPGPFPFA